LNGYIRHEEFVIARCALDLFAGGIIIEFIRFVAFWAIELDWHQGLLMKSFTEAEFLNLYAAE